MKIQNKYLKLAVETMMMTPCVYSDAKLRDIFGRNLLQAHKTYDEKRLSLCEQMCDKDDQGKPVTKDKNYVFSDTIKPEFDTKLTDLMNEEIEIPLRFGDAHRLKNMIEKTQYTPAVGEAEIIEAEFVNKIK